MKPRLAVAVILAAALVVPAVVRAGPPTEQLREHTDAVLRVLVDPALKAEARRTERGAAVRRIANEMFDFAETARRALGRHWQSRTPAEREEFTRLFGDLLERAYISQIDYHGERISFLGDTIQGDVAFARTRLKTKQGTDIPIEYRMLLRGDRWMVYDVVIEGISLVNNYRAQFDKIIRGCPGENLMRCFKRKEPEFLDLARKRP